MPLVCKVAGKTDIGLVRKGNEDYLHIDGDNRVFAVCDGMGGHQAGEVASMTAAETLDLAFSHFSKELLNDERLSLERSLPESGELLVKAARLANRRIFSQSGTDQAVAGMGTTIVAIALEADYMSIAHVGDSRAYRIEKNRLEPLTVDHSWVQEIQDQQGLSSDEAGSYVGKNVITRALGVRRDVEVDYRLIKVKPGDTFMLCSDGLCGFADDDEIFETVRRAEGDIAKTTDFLVQMANDRGGADNVTIIVIRVEEVDSSPIGELEKIKFGVETDTILQAEDEWLEKFSDRRDEIQNAPDATPVKASNPNGLIIAAIFAVFIIVAVFIVYFSLGD